MNIDQKTPYGGIGISLEAIAMVAGNAASECYGVVGLASKTRNLVDNVALLLKSSEFSKGVAIRRDAKKGYEVDIYIIGAAGVKLSEVLSEVQKKVKYDLERTFSMKFSAVNVYLQDVKERE
ncbi:MAG: Asp23/Gls24 family envelope stress response protein [Candidatus Enteromonas sp.]